MKTNNRSSIERAIFRDGERYCDANIALEIAGRQLLDMGNRLSTETRLSSWIIYETAFEVARELNRGYNLGSWENFESRRRDFTRHHEHLCYQDIELMRKAGELKRLGINWKKQK